MAAAELRVDGKPAAIEDLACLALVNYGAYTSFRVEQGGVRGLDLHLARLDASARELFGEPVGDVRLRDLMRAAVEGRDACWLRVSLFSPDISARRPDWTGRPHVLTAVSPPPPPLADSVRLTAQVHARTAPHLKHTAAFELIRARREARAAGFDDALFVDAEGRVSEGSLWNIGFVRGGRVTWPRAPMLAGVTQALLQQGLEALGLPGVTEPVHLDALDRFDGAFICNSATPVCPVVAIDGRAFDPAAAPLDALKAAWASQPRQPI